MEETPVLDEWAGFLKKWKFPETDRLCTAEVLTKKGFRVSFFLEAAALMEVNVLERMFADQLPSENAYCLIVALHSVLETARSTGNMCATSLFSLFACW
jgi:hypothetical protein